MKRRSTGGLGTEYRKLWAASAISNLGDGVRLTALPLLAATLTREPTSIAGIELASTLPWLLFALLAGALVDRIDRRRAMAVANAVRAVLVGSLAVMVLTGEASLVLLYVVAFLLGSAETIFDNAAQAILPSLVPRDQLERANGRLYAAEMVTNQFAGPPVGAFLFVAAAAAPFFLDAASFLIAALLIVGLSGTFRVTLEPGRARTTLRADISEGVRWLWDHRLLRTLAVMLGTWNMLELATVSTLVLFALETLGIGEIGFGMLSASFVIGSIVGSFVAAGLSRRIGPGTTLVLQVATSAVASGVIALASNPILVGAMFAIHGFTSVTWNVITVSMRQSIIPDRLLGRVNSVYRLVGWGSMPVGAALGGLLADGFGLRAPYVVAAVALAAMAVIASKLITNREIAEARAVVR